MKFYYLAFVTSFLLSCQSQKSKLVDLEKAAKDSLSAMDKREVSMLQYQALLRTQIKKYYDTVNINRLKQYDSQDDPALEGTRKAFRLSEDSVKLIESKSTAYKKQIDSNELELKRY